MHLCEYLQIAYHTTKNRLLITTRIFFTGLKVDWKFFGAQNQFHSRLENSQIPQQQELAHPQQSAHLQQSAHPQQSAYPQQSAHSQQSHVSQQQSQSELVQIEPDQLEHRSYLQHQTQPEPQQIPNQIQYKTFAQPQPVQEQPDPNQLQYKVYPQPQAPLGPQSDLNQVQYRYSNAPSQAKQVILEDFKPQSIHPDSASFAYPSNAPIAQQYDQQPANAGISQYEHENYEQEEQHKSRRDYADRSLQGKIVYKEDYEQREQQEPQVEHISVPVERLPPPIPQKLVIDKNMPMEIQQLLQYQARLPYEVIANTISYKPKSLFVPKPFPAETKGPYRYRSKVYYVNNDQYEGDYGTTKPVEESQRH